MPEDSSGPKTVDLSAYDQETIAKAFWLQEHIRRYGIDGIHYSRVGVETADKKGPPLIAAFIEAELKKQL